MLNFFSVNRFYVDKERIAKGKSSQKYYKNF